MFLFRQEEQKWLDALERGELDDFGRVKQDKDVSMMTARQVFNILNFSLLFVFTALCVTLRTLHIGEALWPSGLGACLEIWRSWIQNPF